MSIELGREYTDIITGFTGFNIGRCEYLTGCHQILLQPKGKEVFKKPDSVWFDEQRMIATENTEVITLDNGATPGCDQEAPTK